MATSGEEKEEEEKRKKEGRGEGRKVLFGTWKISKVIDCSWALTINQYSRCPVFLGLAL